MIRVWLTGHLVKLLLAALVSALLWGAWQWREATQARAELDRAGRQFAEYREAQERQHAQALEQLRADRARSDKIRQEALDAAHHARLAAQADADRLRGTAGQLQRYAQDLAASLRHQAGDPAAAGRGPSAGATADLLALVLGRLDDAAAGVVLHADAAGRAGQLCERYYDAAVTP